MKAFTALRLIWHDMRRIARGSEDFWRYFVSKESLEVGLGLFSAEAACVANGQLCRYLVRIANASNKTQAITLIIDIRAADEPHPSSPHEAFFAKALCVEARSALAVEVYYDWLAKAEFFVSGVPSSPDEFRSTGRGGPQWSAVSARLLGPEGTPLDTLTIYQELQG